MLADAGTAFEALFAADRGYIAAYRQQYGSEAHSTSLLLIHKFRGALLSDLELNALDLLRHFNQSRAKGTTAAILKSGSVAIRKNAGEIAIGEAKPLYQVAANGMAEGSASNSAIPK
ncbi:hypothetical protein KCG44_05040 [Pacificimonas sp. WHA3]|uniref:Uncharacterized protein n=1 Tax=Pacificimonas pallii TaxID=2827236 RepID=A0ABS6SCU3_9SPHN|nr:hypothetical protein [Pacificimonas pallii]MBV7256146.1 hypothetical protein [Pacificimonas pallii]